MVHVTNSPEERPGTGNSNDSAGVRRRTIVKGAAWSIPVIAVATATPAAAASTQTNIEFVNGQYESEICQPVDGVTIQVTNESGDPAPDSSVTVTLPDGLSWNDGTSGSKSFVTDGEGRVHLNDVEAVGAEGNYQITAALENGTSAVGSVSVLPQSFAKFGGGDTVVDRYGQVPQDATALPGRYFLADNGSLYYGDTVIATGVTSAVGYFAEGSDQVSYVSDGVGYWYTKGEQQGTASDIPADSTAVGVNYFLTDDGRLYHGNVLVDSGVSSAVGWYSSNDWVTYVRSDGVTVVAAQDDIIDEFRSLPTGTTALGGNYFLTPDGDLYYAGEATPMATGVTSAEGWNTAGSDVVNWVDASGGHLATESQVLENFDVPIDAEAHSGNYFLTPNGEVYHGSEGIVRENVRSLAGFFALGSDQFDIVEYVSNCAA